MTTEPLYCGSVFKNGSEVLKYYDEEIGRDADENDAEEINKLLWSVFDTRVSHLLSVDEIKQKIKDHEIIVYKDSNGKISAILQTITEPKRMYVNQVYNGSRKGIISSIMLNKLNDYFNRGDIRIQLDISG